jgi:hypothetical protein
MSRTSLIAIVLGVDFLLDFVIGFGGVILGAVAGTGVVTGAAVMPGKGLLFLAAVTGLVNAARTAQTAVRSYLAGPLAPPPAPPKP